MHRRWVAAGVVLLAVALAACGGGSGKAPALRATTTVPEGEKLNGDGAVLVAPAAAAVKARVGDCHALVDAGFRGDCGPFGQSVWLVETKGSARRAQVWKPASDKGKWQLALQAEDPTGDTFSDVKAAVVPTAPAAVVFAFRRPGTGDILDIDGVVDGRAGPPSMHLEAEKGSARVAGTTLEVWSAAFAADDPGCCPSGFTHQVVELHGPEWRRVSSRPVGPDGVPASQL